MATSIHLTEIYQRKLNFLIGSGASSGLFPTLWLPLIDSDDETKNETIETLATKLDKLAEKDSLYKNHHTLLFMYYYERIIRPICQFKTSDVQAVREHQCTGKPSCEYCKKAEAKKETMLNYEAFIESIVRLLQHKRSFEKRCNLFTTNYDGCIPLVADELIKRGHLEFHINDGASGFIERTLSARNFNYYVCQTGVFGRNSSDIPQINFINLHGSGYWHKSEDTIKVDYNNLERTVVISDVGKEALKQFAEIINNKDKKTTDLTETQFELSEADRNAFWNTYNKLPIVNPTKWKFYETVFEEHYYQMLRLLSYSLEEQNSVLISFAFSFADEHIRNLVKRSLSNHALQVFVCCFNEKEHKTMQEFFGGYKNVSLIYIEDKDLDFSTFNTDVFNTEILKDVTQ
ncbi:hypothetical protein AB6E21_06025 [Photobacterium swingsii]|uniref:hypothetical protein n=1 Tax=Photobacterium swingsii TaxID=680026 RepID=UPI003552D813